MQLNESRLLVWLGVLIGSTMGGYLPVLWGVETLSSASLMGSLIGGLIGIWAAWKINQLR